MLCSNLFRFCTCAITCFSPLFFLPVLSCHPLLLLPHLFIYITRKPPPLLLLLLLSSSNHLVVIICRNSLEVAHSVESTPPSHINQLNDSLSHTLYIYRKTQSAHSVLGGYPFFTPVYDCIIHNEREGE